MGCEQSVRHPSTARRIKYQGIVPLWNDGTDTDYKQTWSGTVWHNQPLIPRIVGINAPFNHIQFIIKNLGTNDRDEIAYSGGELVYQAHGVTRAS